MMPQFKNMNELVEYLGRLEKRVKSLEEENHTLSAAPAPANERLNQLGEYVGDLEQRIKNLEAENQSLRLASPTTSTSNVDELAIAKMVASFLPLTNIVHPSFLKRAFAVWGHYFVAQFIISLPFTILYFCLLAMMFNQTGRTP